MTQFYRVKELFSTTQTTNIFNLIIFSVLYKIEIYTTLKK